MSNPKNPHEKAEAWLEGQAKNLGGGSPYETVAAGPITLSIIVPAYNEQWRLPPTLVDMVDFLEERNIHYEIIVVDDGSTDGTSETVRKFQRIRPQVRLITLPQNHGKGFAIRQGVFQSRGERILFADADGSTPFAEAARLFTALDAGADVAIGSRAMPSQETKVTTRWYRKWLGRLFNFCVNQIIVPRIQDTQCGFKLFTADAARFLFAHERSEEFSFDVEILFIAQRVGMRLQEVPINWTNVPGSKVNLIVDALKMLRDVFIFKVRHRNLEPDDFASFKASSH